MLSALYHNLENTSLMNRIRKWFAAEVDALLPVLHETYRVVGLWQKSRTARLQQDVLAQLDQISPLLLPFAKHVPAPKRPFFAALANPDLNFSDRIIAMDIAVGAMHIEFAKERAYMHQISPALKAALEEARFDPEDEVAPASDDPEVLVRGIPASPGIATGKAFVIQSDRGLKHLPADAILVAKMTRPQLLLHRNRPGAIVTDIGGSLCHAAILAREWSIPCVVGTETATTTIRSRTWIRVDGTTGHVYRCER